MDHKLLVIHKVLKLLLTSYEVGEVKHVANFQIKNTPLGENMLTSHLSFFKWSII